MDLMIGWFPALKFMVTAIFIWVAYYFFKSGRTKWGMWYLLLLVLFWYFAPIKYDGTQTKTYHKTSENQRTVEYKSVTSDAKIVTTKKQTFAERMKAENARSLMANQKVTDEIVK